MSHDRVCPLHLQMVKHQASLRLDWANFKPCRVDVPRSIWTCCDCHGQEEGRKEVLPRRCASLATYSQAIS